MDLRAREVVFDACVEGGRTYLLRGRATPVTLADFTKAGLVGVQFFDDVLEPIASPYPGLTESPAVGPYAYLRYFWNDQFYVFLQAPARAAIVRITFKAWGEKTSLLLDPRGSFERAFDRLEPAGLGRKLVAATPAWFNIEAAEGYHQVDTAISDAAADEVRLVVRSPHSRINSEGIRPIRVVAGIATYVVPLATTGPHQLAWITDGTQASGLVLRSRWVSPLAPETSTADRIALKTPASKTKTLTTGSEQITAAPSRLKVRKDAATGGLRIATIMDEFSATCFEPEFDLLRLSRIGWQAEIDAFMPHLLLIESAWKGNGGAWTYALSKFGGRHGADLRALIEYCRSLGITAAFWNKEDPVNFDTFAPVASMFDHIFTTDSDCLPQYRALRTGLTASTLPFAAQPSIHNPIDSRRHIKQRLAFAGSWRGDKYAWRKNALTTILEYPAQIDRLDIFDRNADADESLRFPDRYVPFVRGSLPYQELSREYKNYAAFLNVNTVEQSPTMFSRRVFEILASGTPVISTPSVGMTEMLGDAVISVETVADTQVAVDRLLSDGEYRDRLSTIGIRTALEKHTYEHRAIDIAETLSLPNVNRGAKKVSILCVSQRPEYVDNLYESLTNQSDCEFEVIFVKNSENFDDALLESMLAHFPDSKLLAVPSEKTLAEGLNAALDVASCDLFTKFDDDDFYARHYLSEAVTASSYSEAAVVGKNSYFCYLGGSDVTAVRFPDKEYRFCKIVHGATLFVNRHQTRDIRFTPVVRGTDSLFLQSCRDAGLRTYSTSRFNFAHVRRAEIDSHTWKVDDAEFLEKCGPVAHGFRKDLIVV